MTPRAYLEVMLAKSFAGLVDDAAEVGLDQGLAAARELGKLTAQGDDEQKWAEAHMKMGRIVEVMRALPAEYQQVVLAKLDGRPWPPPPGGGRSALVGGGTVTGDDDGFDPLDRHDDFDDED